MDKATIKVEGMTCGGCVKSIENALATREGINRTSADLDAGTVSVEFDGTLIQRPAIEQAITEAGFDVPAQ
ncbi:MAG: heavy-metal-associated domain-containing protein [Gammaproteobacteria bacterium]